MTKCRALVSEWRFLRGWTREELADRIARAAPLRPSAPDGELTPETGWNHVLSHGVLAQEPPGKPLANGPFQHARKLVCRFAFSDERIVVGHYRGNSHVRGRTLMLELKSMGLHFLCPARIGEVREESDDARSCYGFRMDTLEGHIERGREWFLLLKDHASGEVSFRIDASWLPGEFPNLWSEAGFHVLGRRYQRAWHRLAHEHLRAAVRTWDGDERRARGHAAEHGGAALAPIQFLAQKALRPIRVEQEAEHMRRDSWVKVAAMGAMAGVRSAAPPAFLAGEQNHRSNGKPVGEKTALISGGLQLLALGEAIADKFPGLAARTHPVSLAARGLSGALAGAAVMPRRRGLGALVAASAAILATVGIVRLRRFATQRIGVPGALFGLAEDALLLAFGRRLASAMP